MKKTMTRRARYTTAVFPQDKVVVVVTDYDYTQRILRNIARKAVQDKYENDDGAWEVRYVREYWTNREGVPKVHMFAFQNAVLACTKVLMERHKKIEEIVEKHRSRALIMDMLGDIPTT